MESTMDSRVTLKKLELTSLSVKLAKKGVNASVYEKLYDYKRKLFGKHTHLLWELQKN